MVQLYWEAIKKISPTNWQLNPATKWDCSRALATPQPSLTISWQHTIQNSHIEPRQTAKHRRKPESNVAGRWQNKTSVHEFCYGSSRFYRRVFLTSTLHDLYARLRVPLSPRRSPPHPPLEHRIPRICGDVWQLTELSATHSLESGKGNKADTVAVDILTQCDLEIKLRHDCVAFGSYCFILIYLIYFFCIDEQSKPTWHQRDRLWTYF